MHHNTPRLINSAFPQTLHRDDPTMPSMGSVTCSCASWLSRECPGLQPDHYQTGSHILGARWLAFTYAAGYTLTRPHLGGHSRNLVAEFSYGLDSTPKPRGRTQ